jgi:hypothetical protein
MQNELENSMSTSTIQKTTDKKVLPTSYAPSTIGII